MKHSDTEMFRTSTKLTSDMLKVVKDMKLDPTATLVLHLALTYQCFLRDLKQRGNNQPFEEWDLDTTLSHFVPNGVPQAGVL